MASENKLWLVVLLFFAATNVHLCVGTPQVPCVFIFGDSLSDSGNNNNLPTIARANFMPYGIDFPTGPTGRFTNGRTAIDFITEALGFDHFIPPYANTSGSDIIEGVNYASGAAGIRRETGTQAGPDISLEVQLSNHKVIISQITNRLGGPEKAQQHLSKCLYYMNIGSNDYINNYFLPDFYNSSRNYTPEKYAEALVQQYAQQIRILHETGARKFAVTGLGLIGCIPQQITKRGTNGVCVEEDNKAVLLFDDKLKALVDQFNNEFPDSKFVFVDNALVTSENYPMLKGMRSVTIRCCQFDMRTGQCIPNKTPCNNRNLHIFYDSFHPTEAVNKLMAASAYISSIIKITHPIDIFSLVKINLN
ncbi:hypothetical protein RIF29_40438 [Crotalaria pallida]|uniref:Uncharacterized protein n=1 Tax=Crotalaria pallida TaxID=3830 RepID=A0AAN9E4R0_CROPI